jgi:hypothetical protein
MATFLIFLLVGAVLTGFFYLFTRDAYLTGYAQGWDECADQHEFPPSNVRVIQGRDAA